MKKTFLLLASLFSILFFSCRKNTSIEFDQSRPLSLSPDVSWALITEPYVAFRRENLWAADVVGHCRKGDVLMVVGKSITQDGVWYEFEGGWIPENSLSVYSNRYKAETARSGLK